MIRRQEPPSYNEVVELIHYLREQEQRETMTTFPQRVRPLPHPPTVLPSRSVPPKSLTPFTFLMGVLLCAIIFGLSCGTLYYFYSALHVSPLSLFGLLRVQTGLFCLGLLIYCLRLLLLFVHQNS